MKKAIKYILLTLLVLFILIQFYPRPEKNVVQGISENDISISHKTTLAVQQILVISCYDCHSDNTNYPFYSNIQPFAWWLGNHVKDGKKHLNFSQFGSYPADKQRKKLKEIIEEVEDGEMPLSSYILGHPEARLKANEKALLLTWAEAEMRYIKKRD
jgi:hypothetical protein